MSLDQEFSTAPDRVLESEGLAQMLAPQTIAILGASSDPTKIGGRPLRFLMENGFKGAIFPINPAYEKVQGLQAYASISDVPEDVDVAIVALPKKAVIGAVEECGAKGVKHVIVFSAGFSEVDEEGAELEGVLVETAQRHGMRILGPNCIGAMNRSSGASLTFAAAAGAVPTRRTVGKVAFATQSGALSVHCVVAGLERGVDFDPWISTGNEADIDVADAIQHFASAGDVRAIAVYMEGCRDGEKLRAALRAARAAHKPVILLKVGRSEAGARAALSHTGALAGSDTLFEVVCAENNVCRVDTIEELIDVSYAYLLTGLPASDNVGILTSSGGVGILMADAASDMGISLHAPSEQLRRELTGIWPLAGVGNPIDTTAQAMNDPELLPRFLEAVLDSSEFDTIIGFFTYIGLFEPWREQFLAALSHARKHHPRTRMLMSILATQEIRTQVEELDIPVFEDPTAAVRAFGKLVDVAAGFRKGDQRSAGTPVPRRRRTAQLSATRTLSEAESAQTLRAAGIPMLMTAVAHDAGEAAVLVEQLGSDAVLKLLSPDVLHKSDIGGVELGISTGTEGSEAFERIVSSARQLRPNARIEGVIVAPLVSGGVETIVGTVNDPTFGPAVMFGMGGVHTELFSDTAYRLAPVSRDEALDMIRETKASKLLDGFRGGPRHDVDALADLICRLSSFAVENIDTVDSTDLNPVLVRADGQGVIALDALVIERSAADHDSDR